MKVLQQCKGLGFLLLATGKRFDKGIVWLVAQLVQEQQCHMFCIDIGAAQHAWPNCFGITQFDQSFILWCFGTKNEHLHIGLCEFPIGAKEIFIP